MKGNPKLILEAFQKRRGVDVLAKDISPEVNLTPKHVGQIISTSLKSCIKVVSEEYCNGSKGGGKRKIYRLVS